MSLPVCDSNHNSLWRPSWPEIIHRAKLSSGPEEIAMMTLYRLVRLIENNSHALATCLLDRVHNSEATPEYSRVSAEDLKERVYEIYRHLGDWLMTKDELDLEQRYLRIGARRAKQQVPFSQVTWAIVLTKDNLWEFLKKERDIDRPVEVFGELEMLQLLDHFFDRAIYYAAIGYEKACTEMEIEHARATA
jgi:hypothetical protein